MTDAADMKNWLSDTFSSGVRFDEPMSRHTTFKTGGPAEMFAEPETYVDAVTIINKAGNLNIPVMVIGGGSNLIISDTGIKGLVISLSNSAGAIRSQKKDAETVIITADAGMKTHDVCRYAIKNGLTGMNFALGIPGTIGGSISMNAGTATGEIKDVLSAVNILNGSGSVETVQGEHLSFSYRKLDWGDVTPPPVIFSAEFCLKKGNIEMIKKEADDLLKTRKNNQPVSLPSAGCIFKNPDPANPAGKLIDLAGLKGKRIGNAQVSDRHANFIVNTGGALSSDILALISLAQKKVLEKFGIHLETEVKIIG